MDTIRTRIRKHGAGLLFAGVTCLLALGLAHAGEASSPQSPRSATVQWVECGGGWPQKGCEAALVWGDWASSTHGWWVRAPRGHEFVRHSHTAPERILLLEGRMIAVIDGAQAQMVEPGMYVAFPGSAVHWARCEDACIMYITYDAGYDLRFP